MKGRKFELADPSLGRRSKEEKMEMVFKHWESFLAEKSTQRRLQLQKLFRLEHDIKSKTLEYANTQKEIVGLMLQFDHEFKQAIEIFDGIPDFDTPMQQLSEIHQQSPLLNSDFSEARICKLH